MGEIQNHEVEVVAGPDDFFARTRADFAAAARRLWVETYIVEEDVVGRELGEALADAARRGVDARLLYDPGGSFKAPRSFFAQLREQGVSVRHYGRFAALGILKPSVRDHGRLIVADDVAYTGGHNWSDAWAPQPKGEGWQDVSVRITGPVVGDAATVFEQRFSGGEAADFDTGPRYVDVRLIADNANRIDRIEQAHLAAFRAAHRRIWIAHGYFLPRRRFLGALYDAASRDVDVRVILPGPTDLVMIRSAARAEHASWLARGVRLFEYEPAVMHSKYALVDDAWAAVGSFNAVPSSAIASLESALIVRQPDFVSRLAAQFECDRRRSKELSLALIRQRGVVPRIVDGVANVLLRGLAALAGQR